MKIFLDSSVLVAACASKTGASALILGLCKIKRLQGFVSLEVIGEARRNVNLKLGKTGKDRLAHFLKFANLFLSPEPLPEEIARCGEYINEKDAPILAAACKSPISLIITLDKKHFLQTRVKRFIKPLKIVTPREFVLKYLRNKLDRGR